jgi:hypothetical protein
MSSDVLDLDGVGQLGDDDGPEDAAGDDAPYGYLKDGVTPRRKPGPPPGAGKTMPPPPRRGRRTSRRGGGPSTTTPRASSPSSGSKAARDPLIAGAEAILSIPAQAFSLAGLGMRLAAGRYPTGPDEKPHPKAVQLATHGFGFTADAAALMLHGPAIAEGLAEFADDIPAMAGVLLKAAEWGGKSKLVTAVAGLFLQGLVNHGVMPAHPLLGTVDPHTLIEQTMGTPPAQ